MPLRRNQRRNTTGHIAGGQGGLLNPDPAWGSGSSLSLDTLDRARSESRTPLVGRKRRRPGWPALPCPAHHLVAASLLLLAPVSFIIAWTSGDTLGIGLTPHVIGGRLTQVQAKTADFVLGAVIAPLGMVILNFYWFASMRVTMLNELDRTSVGVPILSLVEASRSNTGSYDPLKFLRLVRSRRPKLILFAIVGLLSAVAQTSFANAIAYEAFDETVRDSSDEVTLRALMSPSYASQSNGSATNLSVNYNFSVAEQQILRLSVRLMLDSLSFKGAAFELDDDGDYVAANVTGPKLESLPQSIVELRGVPGYKLSQDCRLRAPDQVHLANQEGRMNLVKASFMFNDTAADGHPVEYVTHLKTRISGLTAILDEKSRNDERLQFVGFNRGRSGAFIGFVKFGRPDWSVAQSLGELDNSIIEGHPSNFSTTAKYRVFNMTGRPTGDPDSVWKGYKSSLVAYGFECSLYRMQGSLSYNRASDGSGRLMRVAESWREERIPAYPLIQDWGDFFSTYTADSSGQQVATPGLGPVLYGSAVGRSKPEVDYGLIAKNLLFATGEVERLAYEMMASDDASPDRGSQHTNISFAVARRQQFYRITHVPAITLTGLLSVLLISLLSLGMMAWSAGQPSLRAWRKVDAVRVIVDTADGLAGHRRLRGLAAAANDQVDDVAGSMRVRYELGGPWGDKTLRLAVVEPRLG